MSAARGAVVVTGASTGIGRACALHLAGVGFHVFAGVRKPEDGAELERSAAGALTPLQLDVTRPEDIAAARRDVERAAGGAGLAGLVNNAGVAAAGPLELLPVEVLRRQLEVNVTAQLAVTQAFLPLLRQARGRVVNMGSISGRMASPFIGPYAASKFALEALTDSLRVELRPWGIHVSIVEPGRIATPIWEKSLSTAGDMLRAMPAEAQARLQALYGPALDRMRAFTQRLGDTGIPPIAVARVVEHALTAPRPKTRYVIGREARVQALLARFVPDRLRDALVVRTLNLPG